MASLSLVAGIFRDGKCNRLVVTYPEGLKYHINEGEYAVIIPGQVQEPISNESASKLIHRAEKRNKTRQARRIR